MPITGNTQGIKLRINPPKNIPNRTGRNFAKGSGGAGAFTMAVDGTSTERLPLASENVRIPESCSLAMISSPLKSSLRVLRSMTKTSPSARATMLALGMIIL